MQPTLDKIWLDEFDGEKALRADFSNDRHWRVVIRRPHGNEQLAQALIDLARNIRRDHNLAPNSKVSGERSESAGLTGSTP